MEFKDYYAKLGVEPTASQDDIKRAYRKLARKYHPDVSKEPDAEARFKEVSEAYEAIGDAERRAAYDEVSRRYRHGQEFEPPPGWNGGYEFSGRGAGPGDGMDFSDFFESLFGRHAGGPHTHAPHGGPGADHHAKIVIDLEDSFHGARRTLSLRVPSMDGQGRVTWQERQLDVSIPKGVRDGQHLRLSGQGAPAPGGGPAGDLYLEVAFRPHPQFRVDGRDIYVDLPLAPWEAALGGAVTAPTPEGPVQLTVPAGSAAGRKLRLKARGLPGRPPGDLYAVLGIVAPPADSEEAKEAYAAMARSFASFNPRSHLQR